MVNGGGWLWVVVGGSGYILAGGGWWIVMGGFGSWWGVALFSLTHFLQRYFLHGSVLRPLQPPMPLPATCRAQSC